MGHYIWHSSQNRYLGPRLEDMFDLLIRPEWHAEAECRGAGAERFFPAPGDSHKPAMRICAACKVRKECADYAETYKEPAGIWGGIAVKERKRRAKRAALDKLEEVNDEVS